MRPTKRTPQISAELLEQVPPLEAPGDLNTIDDLQREWQRVHRAHFRRQLANGEYNQLMYGLQSGSAITRARDELRNAREALEQDDRIAAALEAIDRHRGATVIDSNALEFTEPVPAQPKDSEAA